MLQEILEDFKYPDLGIVQDMRDGFSLVGTAEGGGILPAEFQPATLTINDLSMQDAAIGPFSTPPSQAAMKQGLACRTPWPAQR